MHTARRPLFWNSTNHAGRFVEGDLYIFAYDPEGNTLALPFQPDLIGKNRWNTTDANGTTYIQDLIRSAQSGGGFVHYLYLDPADNYKIKPKLSYAMMVDQGWLIGSGIYDAKCGQPDSKRWGEIKGYERTSPHLSGRRSRMRGRMEKMPLSASSTTGMARLSVAISISMPLIITERPSHFPISPS